MHPTHIVIVVENQHRENIICATVAYSQEDAQRISTEWACEAYYVEIVPCDYNMRGE